MYSFVKMVYKSFINYMYPTVKKSIPSKTRTLVWQRYYGHRTEGTCYACGRYIDQMNWHCSHVISDKRGGTVTLDNLRPCCQHCNLSCGKQNLYAYIRDKQLVGVGKNNVALYMKHNPSQRHSKRI